MKIIDYESDSYGNVGVQSTDAIINVIGYSDVGYNGPKIVEVNGVKGFLKESSNSTPTFDKFEYLISKLGKYLNIKTADEYLIIDDDKFSLFSKSVVNDDEKLIMASKLSEEIINSRNIPKEVIEREKIKKQEFNRNLEALEMEKYTKLIASGDQIDYAISMFIDIVKILQLPNEEEIIKDYIKMCIFDSIIGNKDRNLHNFGLIKGNDGSYSFAPLFDSSAVSMPEISPDYCQVNDYLFDRKELLKYLLDKYPEYANEILEKDIDDIGQKLTNISKTILNEKELKWFNDTVLIRLNSKTFDIVKNKSF